MDKDKDLNQDKEKAGGQPLQNVTGSFIRALGIGLMVLGLIIAIVLLAQASEEYGDSETVLQVYAGITFLSSIITGSLFIGMAEIIKLLDWLTGTDSSHTESS